MSNRIVNSLALCVALTLTDGALAQQPAAPPPYSSAGVTLDQARTAIAAAETEAKKNGWQMAIVVVSNEGDLIQFSRMDNTVFGSSDVAVRKAKTAAAFRRPSKFWQDRLTDTPPALAVLTLGVIAVEGGLPLVADGKMIGAIGCSGGTGAQDSQVCTMGAATIK
jgi:glc operon protein GlcG